MTPPSPSLAVGRPARTAGFIERHGLWGEAQREAAAEVEALIKQRGIRRIRVGWGDQHGIVRGKTLTVREFLRSLSEGKDFQLVTAIFDTTNHPIVPPFAAGNFKGAPELTGLPDGVLVPDPTTFRVLPWARVPAGCSRTPTSPTGIPAPFSTRTSTGVSWPRSSSSATSSSPGWRSSST